MIRLMAWVLALVTLPARVASWEFTDAFDVSPEQPGVFHQLDSAGRKHVAVSGDIVAIVWEESRAGATQANAALGGDVVAVWSEEVEHHPRIRLARLKAEGRVIRLDGRARDADSAPPKAEQLYPDVALTPAGVTVAWENRRAGHTILLYAFSKDGRRFSKSAILNEQPPKRSEIYGRARAWRACRWHGTARAVSPLSGSISAIFSKATTSTQASRAMAGASEKTRRCGSRGRERRGSGARTLPCRWHRGRASNRARPLRSTPPATCISCGSSAPRRTRRRGCATQWENCLNSVHSAYLFGGSCAFFALEIVEMG
jgi:hypothetical protein